MSTKVKGIFKGFKYITQIFDEKEKEMQIGFPTDVKHVAHIGIDGQSASTPSWMNEFKDGKNGTVDSGGGEEVSEISTGIQKSMQMDANEEKKSRSKSSSKSSTSPLDNPKERPPDAPKPRRHHHRSSEKESQDSSSSGKGRRIRRHANNGHDTQEVPKHSHRRKSKGSSNDGGSSKSRASKCKDSLSDDHDQYSAYTDFGSAGVGHRQAGHVSKENEHIAMAISA